MGRFNAFVITLFIVVTLLITTSSANHVDEYTIRNLYHDWWFAFEDCIVLRKDGRDALHSCITDTANRFTTEDVVFFSGNSGSYIQTREGLIEFLTALVWGYIWSESHTALSPRVCIQERSWPWWQTKAWSLVDDHVLTNTTYKSRDGSITFKFIYERKFFHWVKESSGWKIDFIYTDPGIMLDIRETNMAQTYRLGDYTHIDTINCAVPALDHCVEDKPSCAPERKRALDTETAWFG